jgi:cystathionine beta-lyase
MEFAMKQTTDPALASSTAYASVARRIDALVRTASVPVVRASSVLFESLAQVDQAGRATAQGVRHATTSGTAGLPTTMALMDAVAQLEGAGAPPAADRPGPATRAALVPSGLAAIAVAILAFVKAGEHLLVPDSAYGPCRGLCLGQFARAGIETTFYDPRIQPEALAALIKPNTRILYLESPGSYTFEIQDTPALAALARSRGVLSVIDNALVLHTLDSGVALVLDVLSSSLQPLASPLPLGRAGGDALPAASDRDVSDQDRGSLRDALGLHPGC